MTTDYQRGWDACVSALQAIAAEASGISDGPRRLALTDAVQRLQGRSKPAAVKEWDVVHVRHGHEDPDGFDLFTGLADTHHGAHVRGLAVLEVTNG